MDDSQKHKTLLVMVIGLLVLSFIFKSTMLVYSATAIGLVSLIIPVAGDWIVKGWLKLAAGLGWINSRILLTVIFYVFLYPLALLSKLFTRNLLQLKNNTSSVYETRNHLYTKEDLENIW